MSVVAGFILPHPPLAHPKVGRGQERGIQSTLDAAASVAQQIANISPETIVIMSPHTAYYQDWIHLSPGSHATGSFVQFGAPDAVFSVTYDQEFRDALIENAYAVGIDAGTDGERERNLDHGILVPLTFLGDAFNADKTRVVRIGGSALPRETLYDFGACIAKTARELGRRTVVIASGDLSHKLTSDGPYGFDPAGPEFDEAFGNIVRSGSLDGLLDLDDALCEDAAECGLSGFIMLSGALDECNYKAELLSLEGPFGVGYGVASFLCTSEKTLQNERSESTSTTDQLSCEITSSDPLVQLAARAVREWVTLKELPKVSPIPDGLPPRAGCFVSIHTLDGDLRGCIGTIQATEESLAKEIVRNAVLASTRDTRFSPITPGELCDLTLSVDVLGEAEPATFADLDPKRYGVIVTLGSRRGLLLPDLEGVDTAEEQVRIACAKAGISPHENFELERFEVVRHV